LHGNVAAMSVSLVEPSVAVPVTLAAVLYLRGWSRVRRRLGRRVRPRHVACFMVGLTTLLLALSAPIETLAERWLSVHMVQHMLLTVVVAPLLWMGGPVVPLFVGSPRPVRGAVLRLVNRPDARGVSRWILHPAVAWS